MIMTATKTERRENMKDSEIYKKLQELVIVSGFLNNEEKIAILRVLFEQEDLALYTEECEQKKQNATEKCDQKG